MVWVEHRVSLGMLGVNYLCPYIPIYADIAAQPTSDI